MAPRSKGKANMINGAIDEEDEYDNWVNKNREVRNSITDLPGGGNDDLPERAFSKSTTKRMDKNSRSSKR